MSPGKTRAQALDEQHQHAVRAFGTHRSYEHLQECYLLGDVDHQLARLRELATHGMDYVVLGPLTDDIERLDFIAEHLGGRAQPVRSTMRIAAIQLLVTDEDTPTQGLDAGLGQVRAEAAVDADLVVLPERCGCPGSSRSTTMRASRNRSTGGPRPGRACSIA